MLTQHHLAWVRYRFTLRGPRDNEPNLKRPSLCSDDRLFAFREQKEVRFQPITKTER